jgi:hypothetical protein
MDLMFTVEEAKAIGPGLFPSIAVASVHAGGYEVQHTADGWTAADRGGTRLRVVPEPSGNDAGP